MVVSHRESCRREQGTRSDYFLTKTKGEIPETHVIGHAHGDDGITKNTPNVPYLQGWCRQIIENKRK